MPTASEIVSDFIALWEKPEGFPEAVDRYFTEETVWENHGVLTTRGKREAVGFYEQFSRATGMVTMRIDVLALAETGSKVLTERIDTIIDAGGKTVMTVPVMGAFEIADGKITVWRDFFDTIANAPPPA